MKAHCGYESPWTQRPGLHTIAAMSAPKSANPEVLALTKVDVARRQLQTAITLWFTNGDPVSVHTLAAAAHEIIHTVTKKRTPNRRPVVDSRSFTDEGRTALTRH
jgi:hypothetical protein